MASAAGPFDYAPYAGDIIDWRTYDYRHIAPNGPPSRDPIAQLLDAIPNDAIPFGAHPHFEEFYAKLDVLFRTFLRNLYVAVPGAPFILERLGAARRGVPKRFEAPRVPDLVEHGRSFALFWNRRFAYVLGRASTFLSVAESDVFVGATEDHVAQIRNFLLLMASESRREQLALFECARILKNVNHVRLLGPHDRLQDCLVIIAAAGHLLEIALQIRRERGGTQGLWSCPLPPQRGYSGAIRLTFGQLLRHSLIRGMDPDLYDTEQLTPRALIEEPRYRPNILTRLGRRIWSEGAVSALLQMLERLPAAAHADLDRLLVEVFHTPHVEWQQDPWFQSPYVSLTIASAAQVFLNLLSVPLAGPLPLADLAFFPMLKRDVIASLADGTTRFSTSLTEAIQPGLDGIEQATYFGMKDDFPNDRIVLGPIYRRLTSSSFAHMPPTYLSALREVAERKSLGRLGALLADVQHGTVASLERYLRR